jgi:glycosyltransferase involved in cell wall biosynthesis
MIQPEDAQAQVDSHALVTICIPTYLGARFLAEAIQSVLDQTYAHFELWIVDDCSPDHTAEIVAAFSDPRINYIRNESNLGPEGNWNRCLALGTGRYYKLLPHDDVLAPDCLDVQRKVFDDDVAGDVQLVFGSRSIIDSHGKMIMNRSLPNADRGVVNSSVLVRRCILAGTNLIGEPGGVMFRREVIAKVGLYDAANPYVVDLDYWFRILDYGQAFYTNTRVSSFRLSSSSWSVAIGRNQPLDFQRMLAKYCSCHPGVISRRTRMIGLMNAHLKNLARLMIYFWLGLSASRQGARA